MSHEKVILSYQLMCAIGNGSLSDVKNLLEKGADVNFENLHGKHETPLHEAVLGGNATIVELLLANGANTEAKTVDNKKPMDLCALLEDDVKRTICKVLMKHSGKIRSDGSKQRNYLDSPLITFTKRQGTANVGQFYEIKLLTMVLFRLLHDDQIENFLLGNNLDEAGAFDDVVFRTCDGGKSRVCCLQAKHKNMGHEVNYQDLMNDVKGDFSLVKYFESYLSIRYMFGPFSEHAIFQGEFEQTELELVIFTSAMIKYNEQVYCQNTNNCDKFYSKKMAKTAQLKCNQSLLDSFVLTSQAWHKKAVSGILAKLILSQKYNTLNLMEALEKLWKENILSKFTNQNISVNSSELLQLYSNPKLEQTSGRNVKQISENIAKLLNEETLPSDSSRNMQKVSENIVDLLKKTLPSKDKHEEAVKDFFAKLKIYSEQATEDELDEIIRHDIKTANYESEHAVYSKSYDAVENWWKQSGQVSFLTESCEIFKLATNEVQLDKVQAVSLKLIRSEDIKFRKSEFVSSKGVNLHEEAKNAEDLFINVYGSPPEFSCIKLIQYFKFHQNDIKFVIIDKRDTFDILEVFSKAHSNILILAYVPEPQIDFIADVRKKIKKLIVITSNQYPGSERSIKDETESMLDLEPECQMKLLETLVTFQSSSIPLSTLIDEASREFIDAGMLQKLIRGEELVISNAQYSNGNEDVIENYIDRVLFDNRHEQQISKSISDICEALVIVAAEPGMGKSALLTELAHSIKKSSVSTWVVKINLLDYSSMFYEWDKTKITIDKTHAMELLMKATISEKSQIVSFEKKLFRWYCEQFKSIFLVDGFDEISPDYTGIVLKLLHFYKDDSTAKVWITTRTGGAQTELERSLKVKAYTLKPFTMDETRSFLWNFWTTELGITSDQKILFDGFMQQLLLHLSRSIELGGRELISIPLQIKMIAIVFQDSFKECYASGGKKIDLESIDSVNLYEKFIKHKFNDVLQQEKYKTDVTRPGTSKQIMENFHQFEIKHEKASFFALFNKGDMTKLLNRDEIKAAEDFLEEVHISVEKTGIITRVVDGMPIFVHQTYAEFFAAQFLWNKICSLQDKEFKAFVEDVLINSLICNEQVQITKFLLGMVKKDILKFPHFSSKAYVLLDKLQDVLPGTWRDFDNKAFSHLLGIAECCLATYKECREQLSGLIEKKIENFRNLLLLKTSEAGYILLASVLTDANTRGVDETFHFLYGWTALHFAAGNNHPEIIKLLVEKGAKIDCTTSNDGRTPLYFASERGFVIVVKTLLNLGANVHLGNKYGYTPLHRAAYENHPEIIELLVEKGAKIECTTSIIRRTPLYQASLKGAVNAVKSLLSLGANVHLGNTLNGHTPLHIAASTDHPEIIEILVEKGAKIDCTTSVDRRTPLYQASLKGAVNAVKTLLSLGANVHLGDTLRVNTPLHTAAFNNHPEIIEFLVEKGAKIDCTTSYNRQTPLYEASQKGAVNAVKTLLSLGANVQLGTTNDNYTPLHTAAFNNHPEIIELLMQKGAQIDCTTSDDGRTPLYEASKNGSVNAVKTLLSLGANVHLSCDSAITPLKIATQNNYHEIVNLLVDKGAKID